MHSSEAKIADRILRQLLELPEAERAACIKETCGDNSALQALVERLLLRAEADDTRLRPAGGLHAMGVETKDFLPKTLKKFELGDHIGVFRIVRELGHGGMATVYLAERNDGQFEQNVALKILDRVGDSLPRFEQERQILASLDHPNIARLVDGGVTNKSVPFVAMEYVEGEPLLEYCDRLRFSIEERLKVFVPIVEAVHDAHRKLIVHRDIKSANILVTKNGVPKLLDFGIAKLLSPIALPHAAPVTRAMKPMTPEYASPEQIRGESMTVATDIYQLGHLLYLLLVGRSPYKVSAGDIAALAEAITQCDPLIPSQRVADVKITNDRAQDYPWVMRGTTQGRLQRTLKGDLDRVILKALHKDPDNRYRSASQLTSDIANVLAGRPVTARPDTLPYRTHKFIRRNRLAVSIAAAALTFGIVGTASFTYQLSEAKNEAEIEAEKSAQVSNFLVGLFEANDPKEALGEDVTASELLERGREQADRLKTQPEVQAELYDVMGQIYLDLGQYEQAESLITKALELRRTHLPELSLDLAESLLKLGTLLKKRNDFANAESVVREALDIQLALLSEQDPLVAATLNDVGNILGAKGEYDQSADYLRQALQIRQRHFDADHPDVTQSTNSLAINLMRLGDYDQSEALHRQNLSVRRKSLPETHPDIGATLNNLGLVLHRKGKLGEAAILYRELLENDIKVYGEEHPNVALSLSNLGQVLGENGDFDEATATNQKALAMLRKFHNEHDPRISVTLANMAVVAYKQHEFELAEDLFGQALEIQLAVYGADSTIVAGAQANLGKVLLYTGDVDRAEALLRQSLHTLRARLGSGHPALVTRLTNLGKVLVAKEKFDEAEKFLLEAREIGRDRMTTRHRSLDEALEILIELYEAWGKQTEAARYRTELDNLDGQ